MVRKLAQHYERRGLDKDSILYPPPGFFVDFDNRRLHIQKHGSSGPPVILEAGIAASSLSWALVYPELATFCTVYAYDRAGFGWSPPNDSPKVARALIEEMRLALAAAQVPTPRIVVGHSFGGMLMRMYAAMYPEEVSGVVLVDALPPEEWFPLDARRTHMLRRGVELSRRGAWLARHGLVRFALRSLERGNQTIPKLLSLFSGAAGVSVPQRIASQIAKLPRDVQGMVRAHWSRAASFQTMAEYLLELPASCAQALICPPLDDKPLIVLSASQGQPGHQGRQARLAKLSRQGDFRLIPGATHWLMLDAPHAVIDAVRDLCDSCPIQ